MGYAVLIMECCVCGGRFSANPHKCCSIRIDSSGNPSDNGERRPVCRPCVLKANKIRRNLGLEQFPINHEAYDDPVMNETEI
jgi:hypothetical protein